MGILHNDAGNSCNYLADDDGNLFLIDFGLSKDISSASSAPLALTPSLAPDANLLALYHLLYDAQQGLIEHGILKEPPALLIRSYNDFLRRMQGGVEAAPLHPEAATAPETGAAAEAARAAHQRKGRRTRSSAKADMSAVPVIDLNEVETKASALEPARSMCLRQSPPPRPRQRGSSSCVMIASLSAMLLLGILACAYANPSLVASIATVR